MIISLHHWSISDVQLPLKVRQIKYGPWDTHMNRVIKSNVDGSSLGKIRISGVAKNEQSEVIGITSKFIGQHWAYETKTIAIMNALLFYKSIQIVIYFD